MNLKNVLISLIAIAFVVLLPHSGIIPFSFMYTIPILLFVWIYLKCFRENFSDIAFDIKKFHFKIVLIGAVFGIMYFVFSQLLLFPAMEQLVDFDAVEVELYTKLKGNTSFYIFILIAGCLVGGVYEEIIFHGFIFSRLEKIIPGNYSTHLSFIITCIIFGFYHYQLGSADAINAFIIGAGYLGLILYFKRNLWYGIICHSVYNSMAITMLYLGYL